MYKLLICMPIFQVLIHSLPFLHLDGTHCPAKVDGATADVPILKGDPDDEIVFQYLPNIIVYKSGRVERFRGTDIVPAGFDPKTQVVSKDVTINATTGVTARLYLPTATTANEKLPILVYFHGGAFMFESPFSPAYHPHLNNLASLGPVLAISVNYRLAPEHRLPTAYEDSWAALQWVFSKGDSWLAGRGDFNRLYIAGDSAGGNICQQMVVRAGQEGVSKITGMALVFPGFWGVEPVGIEEKNGNYTSFMKKLWPFIFPSMIGLDDPRINPVAQTAPSLVDLGCRKVLVTVAEKDGLWSRGILYYEKLKSSGWIGEVELINIPDAEHDFHIYYPETEKAIALTKQLATFFAKK